MLNKAVQAAIYEKVLKKHYMEVLYIDFEDTGKCKKLHQDTKLVNGENIFPESDEQMFDYYESILLKVMIVSRLLTQVLVQFFSVSFKINNG